MARIGRVVVPGMPHHVTQRGNRRMQTFFRDDDYRSYLALAGEWCRGQDVSIWGDCLMPNHVHLILVPATAEGLAKALGESHRRYTRLVNFRESWRGYLWQGRFGSVVMDEPHLLAAARYVEMNPVRAHLAARPEDWPWSSAAAHVGAKPDALAQSAWLTERTAGWVCSWGEYLMQNDGRDVAPAMRRHESTGRPLGDKSFVERVSTLLGRDLLPKKRGPKLKERN
jgi:putative transposase